MPSYSRGWDLNYNPNSLLGWLNVQQLQWGLYLDSGCTGQFIRSIAWEVKSLHTGLICTKSLSSRISCTFIQDCCDKRNNWNPPSWYTKQKQNANMPGPPLKWDFSCWLGPNVNQPKQMVWRAGLSGWPWSVVTRGGRATWGAGCLFWVFFMCAYQWMLWKSRALSVVAKIERWSHVRPACFAGASCLCGTLSMCDYDRTESEMDDCYSEGFSVDNRNNLWEVFRHNFLLDYFY